MFRMLGVHVVVHSTIMHVPKTDWLDLLTSLSNLPMREFKTRVSPWILAITNLRDARATNISTNRWTWPEKMCWRYAVEGTNCQTLRCSGAGEISKSIWAVWALR